MYHPTPSTFLRFSRLGTWMAIRFLWTPSTMVYTRIIITSTNTNTSTPRARYLSCKGCICIVYVYVCREDIHYSIVHIISTRKHVEKNSILRWKSTYIVKLFKLGVVEDEVHSGHLGKDGTITQGVSQCSQPWSDLGEVCACHFTIILLHFFSLEVGL